ncbi:MAG: hypothetical protein NT154_10595, partial [Verrucomicrobia bacterium]|nr:hypothetical protein [Verrucomicrobiota bacterium]
MIAIKKQVGEQQRDFTIENSALSNSLVQTSEQLEQQRKNNAELVTDRDQRKKDLEELSGKYSTLASSFSQVSNNLVQTEVALKASQEETAKRDAKIAGLEAQNQALDKQAIDLSNAITNLTAQIEDTKRKLATSEGEKGFLDKELKRLMAE